MNTYDPEFSLAGNIKHLFKVKGFASDEQMFNTIALVAVERDQFRTSLSELSHKNEQNVCELDAYRAGNHPDLKPQLTEIRYVLHGDIQPCSVLYSDETTTLLRLDEGDVMCETDTIEWPDSVTYRCQELLKREVVKNSATSVSPTYVKAVAQLVRDGRILLNDAAKPEDFGAVADTSGVEQPCENCDLPFDAQSMTCPVCNTIRNGERDTTPEDVANMIANSLNSPANEKLVVSVRPEER